MKTEGKLAESKQKSLEPRKEPIKEDKKVKLYEGAYDSTLKAALLKYEEHSIHSDRQYYDDDDDD